MARRAGCTLTGDWRKLNALMRKISTTADIINDLIRAEAEIMRNEVIEAIQDYNDIPNAQSTVKRKGTDNPLTEKGIFGSTLGVIIEESSKSDKKKYYTIKGNPNYFNRRTGLSYEAIAEILEFGAEETGRYGGYIPPRPVFTITFDRLRRDVSRNIILKARDHYRGL